MSKKNRVNEIKAKAFDRVSELYFNFDWEHETPLKFVTDLGMIITTATIEARNKGNKEHE